jgi:hypothetical protein
MLRAFAQSQGWSTKAIAPTGLAQPFHIKSQQRAPNDHSHRSARSMLRREQFLPVRLIDHPVFDRRFLWQPVQNCAYFLSVKG